MTGQCPNCRNEVDMYKHSCPECGYEFGERQSSWGRKVVWFLVLVLIILSCYLYYVTR